MSTYEGTSGWNGTLTTGGLVVKTTEGGLVVKTTEVGEDIWDLDISRWGDVAIMGVEDELAGREFGSDNKTHQKIKISLNENSIMNVRL